MNSNTVRLGAYDLTKDDGEHTDIPIDHVEMHKSHSSDLAFQTFDIAIVYLTEHLQFTGKLEFYLSFCSKKNFKYPNAVLFCA